MPLLDSHTREAQRRDLLERLKPRLAVEEYFGRSGRTFRKSRFRLWFNRTIKTRLLKAAFKGLGLYQRGYRNALSPELRRVRLYLPDLPRALDGFEILHLSDLHIDRLDSLDEAVAGIVEGLRPDMCVLTGDYRWEINGTCSEVYPRMRTVLRSVRARHGVFGILGNHDPAEIAFELEDMGVRMLVNDAAEVVHNGESLWVAGTDDSFDYRCADLEKTLSGVPSAKFTVLLTHTPELYEMAAKRGVRLYLCGHTHAGQLRLPWLGAVKKNAPVPRRMVQGRWTHNGMQGYTSWGAGCSTVPLRFNCPAEVALLELRREMSNPD